MRRACAGLVLFFSCAPVHVSPFANEVYRVGRFDDSDPAGPRFLWSASRFSFRFFGESVHLKLRQTTRPVSAEAGPQPLRVRVELDGAAHELYADDSNLLELRAELPPGRHRVTVVRQSEALIGEGQLVDIELSAGAKLLSWDERGRPLVEFIGDSVTVGFGDEGKAPCPFTSQTEAITSAFPWLVGEKLKLDVRVVGWSGHGVTRDWGDRPEPTVPQQWVPQSPPPNVVLVALGANDFWNGDPGPEPLTSAYAAFIRRVHAAYPLAGIYAVITPTGTPERREAMRRYFSAAGAPLLEMTELPKNAPQGCVGHPSRESQQGMANDVIDRLCRDVKDLCGSGP